MTLERRLNNDASCQCTLVFSGCVASKEAHRHPSGSRQWISTHSDGIRHWRQCRPRKSTVPPHVQIRKQSQGCLSTPTLNGLMLEALLQNITLCAIPATIRVEDFYQTPLRPTGMAVTYPNARVTSKFVCSFSM
jgi:hypothetical protein